MGSTNRQVVEQLGLIADELSAAAGTLPSRLAGQSRELNAWAARVRRIATWLAEELDKDDETRSPEVIGWIRAIGVRIARKALPVLVAAAAASSGIADAPDAIEHSRSAIQEAIEVISGLVEDDVQGEQPSPRNEAGEADQRSGQRPVPADVRTPPEEPPDSFEEWLDLVRGQPARYAGSFKSGTCHLDPSRAASRSSAMLFPDDLVHGDTIMVTLFNMVGSYKLRLDVNGYAVADVAERLTRTGEGEYHAVFRCLGPEDVETSELVSEERALVRESTRAAIQVATVHEFLKAPDEPF